MREQNVLLVPNQALRFSPQEQTQEEGDDKNQSVPQATAKAPEVSESDERVLWVVNGQKLEPVVVKIGVSNSLNTQILSGVKEGQVVALDYSNAAPAASAATEDTEASTEQSPFAPTPPGKKK
jgi:HlyD family secretion protein